MTSTEKKCTRNHKIMPVTITRHKQCIKLDIHTVYIVFVSSDLTNLYVDTYATCSWNLLATVRSLLVQIFIVMKIMYDQFGISFYVFKQNRKQFKKCKYTSIIGPICCHEAIIVDIYLDRLIVLTQIYPCTYPLMSMSF